MPIDFFQSYPAETSVIKPPPPTSYFGGGGGGIADITDEDIESEEEEDDDNFYMINSQWKNTPHPAEITKLNALNHFLSIEGLPKEDKILLIYEKILAEVRFNRLVDD